MAPLSRLSALLALLAGCSIDYDRFIAHTGTDAGFIDRGTIPPNDTPIAPEDNGQPPTDTPRPPADNGNPPLLCHAPYLVAVAENLDNDTAKLLRWSFADNRRCDDLPLNIAHPRAVGVTFDSTSDLTGPQLIVVNDSMVSMVDAATGFVIRDVASEGPPRSVFDIVSNGQGTFAVAYSFTGDSPPGSVGTVRVFDHRSTLRVVQTWQRNAEFGLSVLAMTGFPGNQGQYVQLKSADTGDGYSAYVTSPSSGGIHPRTQPAIIANRANAQSISGYRTVDRRGHYAVPLSGGTGTPVVYIASASVSSSTLSNTYVPTVRCSGEPCPAMTRAVAFPNDEGVAAAVCALSGTSYTVVRVGGDASNCHMLDTTASAGRWRINDLAVMPR